jgi:hypothetical protein
MIAQVLISRQAFFTKNFPGVTFELSNVYLLFICVNLILISIYLELISIPNKETNDLLARWYIGHGSKMVANHKPNMALIDKFFKTGLVEEYEKGESPWPVSYAFMPDELQEIMKENNMKNIKFGGPGALSRTIPGEVLTNIMKDEQLKKEFLEFCYKYDSQQWITGLGKDNIVVNAER